MPASRPTMPGHRRSARHRGTDRGVSIPWAYNLLVHCSAPSCPQRGSSAVSLSSLRTSAAHPSNVGQDFSKSDASAVQPRLDSLPADRKCQRSFRLVQPFDGAEQQNLSQRRWQGSDRSREFFEFHLRRSEEHTSELQSLMRISYAVFCLTKKNKLNKDIE